MQWRRGNMGYRPMVPEDQELEFLSPDDMERLERDDTHFLWELGAVEDESERTRQIEQIVARLWEAARRWAQLRGAWCDFRLFGYDQDEELLFQDGRRCRLDVTATDPAAERGTSGERQRGAERRGERDRGPDWRAFQQTQQESLEQVIDMIKSERDGAVGRADRVLADQHMRWNQLNDAQRETAAFQREQLEDTIAMRSGAVEIKVRAIQEMQRTQRMRDAGEVFKHGIDALVGNAVPFLEHLSGVFGRGEGEARTETLPKFEKAQQAIHYLVLTLSETQLSQLFDGDAGAIRAFTARLQQASAMKVEFDALQHLAKLMGLFKSQLLRDVADSDQWVCARYIIGRLALYQVVSHGEDEAHSTT